MLVQALERQAAVAPRRARRHRDRDEDHLADLRVARAGLSCAPRVRVDTPRTLRDVGDAERDELLRLDRQRALLEGLRIEVEERAVGLGRELAHALELLRAVDAVKHHGRLLSPCGEREVSPITESGGRERCARSRFTAAPAATSPTGMP